LCRFYDWSVCLITAYNEYLKQFYFSDFINAIGKMTKHIQQVFAEYKYNI